MYLHWDAVALENYWQGLQDRQQAEDKAFASISGALTLSVGMQEGSTVSVLPIGLGAYFARTLPSGPGPAALRWGPGAKDRACLHLKVGRSTDNGADWGHARQCPERLAI